MTPLLTKTIMDYDFNSGCTPIVVYPETVSGNPFRAPFVVRYILNFPGLLGGDSVYKEDEFCVTYSEYLVKSVANARLSLFLPVSDPRIFTPYPSVRRLGSCFYAGKYRYVHGGDLFEITCSSVEITRDLPNSQSPEQIAELFRRSEVFYTYENTALVIEALLCGCPVVFLPNKYLEFIIGIEEHGWDGIAWGTYEEEILRAKNTVQRARQNYYKIITDFRSQLVRFIDETQHVAGNCPYAAPINIRHLSSDNYFIYLGYKMEIVKSETENKHLYEMLIYFGIKSIKTIFKLFW
ncbi:hypothetical protein OW715_09515 [Acidithiobacillus ferriphilus]|nr:hypothetical protein [Acidithiobacillus ferriphilus]